MSNQKNEQQESKRKTLKTLLGSTGAVAGASALPETWTKPILSTVILPAHAGTSEACSITQFEADSVEGGIESQVTIEVSGDFPDGTEASLELDSETAIESTSDFESSFAQFSGGTAEFETGTLTFGVEGAHEVTAFVDIEGGDSCFASESVSLPK